MTAEKQDMIQAASGASSSGLRSPFDGHTPLPWRYEIIESMGCNGPVEISIQNDEMEIALVDLEASVNMAQDEANAALIVRSVNSLPALVKTLERAQRLCEEALPKFNWGASALDSNAIQLLNLVPREIANALAALHSPCSLPDQPKAADHPQGRE